MSDAKHRKIDGPDICKIPLTIASGKSDLNRLTVFKGLAAPTKFSG
jgi:hypothetical protein